MRRIQGIPPETRVPVFTSTWLYQGKEVLIRSQRPDGEGGPMCYLEALDGSPLDGPVSIFDLTWVKAND